MNHEDRLQGLDDSDRALVQTLQDWNRVADSPGKPVAAGPWARHVIQQAAQQRRTRGTIASGATALMLFIVAGLLIRPSLVPNSPGAFAIPLVVPAEVRPRFNDFVQRQPSPERMDLRLRQLQAENARLRERLQQQQRLLLRQELSAYELVDDRLTEAFSF